MWACLDCGQYKCRVKDNYCKNCAEKTTRVVRIPERQIMAGSPDSFRQYLHAGESVQSQSYDMQTREWIIVVKKHML